MAFIEKNDPTVLNIKITTKGRELLSKGQLTFNYFAIGDSEIDYNLIKAVTSFDPNYSPIILRPADKNPKLISFIKSVSGGTEYNPITSVPSIPMVIQNDISSLGFFIINSGGTVTINTGLEYMKQPNAKVSLSEMTTTGNTTLNLYQSINYATGSYEPSVNDIVLIKWNGYSGDTLNDVIDINSPKPYIFYKIESIIGGTLAANNLQVTVDKFLPCITGVTSDYAAALTFYSNYSGTTVYDSVDYLSDAVLSFYSNSQCDMPIFPFWKMSILYTEDIAGTIAGDTKYPEFKTAEYAGFVSYIQSQSAVLRKVGAIHYTNSSPSNRYGEGFYNNTPELFIPTIMWHKSSGTTLGVKLTALGVQKHLAGLNTLYYDLADESGNIVGKILNELKMFIIEDQELLFAMSYKANRSWTLPNYSIGVNNALTDCPICTLTFSASGNTPTIYNDGQITIYDIANNILGSTLILEILNGTDRVYYQPITDAGITVSGLSGGTYSTRLYDLGAPNCVATGNTITIIQPTTTTTTTTTTTLPPTTTSTTTTTTLPPFSNNFILSPAYGMSFSDVSGASGVPAFTFPVLSGTSMYTPVVSGGTLNVTLSGTLPAFPIYVDMTIDTLPTPTTSRTPYYTSDAPVYITLPVPVIYPLNITLAINS